MPTSARILGDSVWASIKGSSPSSTPVTMEAKLSSRRIMSAACLDTSEPAIPMATPISAFFKAGESLTPSPVTATIAPYRTRGEGCVKHQSPEVRCMPPCMSDYIPFPQAMGVSRTISAKSRTAATPTAEPRRDKLLPPSRRATQS